MGRRWVPILLCVILIMNGFTALAFDSRADLREAYRAIGNCDSGEVYSVEPVIQQPYATGKISETLLKDALRYLNFIRAVAGLEAVSLDEVYNDRCGRTAVLLAVLDSISHTPNRPENMNDEFYESASLGAASSNLVQFNWMRNAILRDAIAYFVRDDGEANLSKLGHRRWILNPLMEKTGIGLANADSGYSYIALYAHDFGRADTTWSEVCWPSPGVFPVELMHRNLAWSISVNDTVYDIAAKDIIVTLTEENNGLSYEFNCSRDNGMGFCTISRDLYGAGDCLIFCPDFEGSGFVDYQQNQRWKVSVTGLLRRDGRADGLEYTVEMASVFAQDVAAVEMRNTEVTLKRGEEIRLYAQVIPEYADDTTLTWQSSDESVAFVNQDGTATAVGKGVCTIEAFSTNGRSDVCKVIVE